MKVWVIFDPLYEKVLCVHSEEDQDCPNCIDISNERIKKGSYHIEQAEYDVVPSKSDIRDVKIVNILNEKP